MPYEVLALEKAGVAAGLGQTAVDSRAAAQDYPCFKQEFE